MAEAALAQVLTHERGQHALVHHLSGLCRLLAQHDARSHSRSQVQNQAARRIAWLFRHATYNEYFAYCEGCEGEFSPFEKTHVTWGHDESYNGLPDMGCRWWCDACHR